jgi:hypothetical protein
MSLETNADGKNSRDVLHHKWNHVFSVRTTGTFRSWLPMLLAYATPLSQPRQRPEDYYLMDAAKAAEAVSQPSGAVVSQACEGNNVLLLIAYATRW